MIWFEKKRIDCGLIECQKIAIGSLRSGPRGLYEPGPSGSGVYPDQTRDTLTEDRGQLPLLYSIRVCCKQETEWRAKALALKGIAWSAYFPDH